MCSIISKLNKKEPNVFSILSYYLHLSLHKKLPLILESIEKRENKHHEEKNSKEDIQEKTKRVGRHKKVREFTNLLVDS